MTTESTNRRVMKGKLKRLPRRVTRDDGSKGDRVETLADILKSPEGTSDEVIRTILYRAKRAVDYRASLEDDWYRALRAWWQLPSTAKEDGWESDRYFPLILKQIETALPTLMAATMDGQGLWRIHAMTREGKNVAVALERLINWQAATTAQAEEAYEEMLWWALVIGTGYIDHYWDYRREEVRVAQVRETNVAGERLESPVKEVVERVVTTHDHPRVIALNPLDVFPDPDGADGDDNEWYCVRVHTTIGEMRDAAGREGLGTDAEYTNPTHIDGVALEAWIKEYKPHTRDEDSEDWISALHGLTWKEMLQDVEHDEAGDSAEGDDLVEDDQSVVVLRYVSKQEIVTLGGPSHIIGYSRNPHTHGKTGIVTHHFIRVPGSPHGRGLGTALLGHQELMNENLNRWADTAELEAMAPIIVDRAAVSVLDEDFIWEPNKIIRASRMDAIKRLEAPAPTAIAMQMDAHLAADADDLTGFNAQARGQAGPASTTATASASAQSNLQTRLRLHVKRVARTIKLSGQLLIALNQQFLTTTQVAHLRGEEGVDYVDIEPHEIVGETVVRASVSAVRANPELRAQRMIQLSQIVLPLFLQGAHKDPTIGVWLRTLLDLNEVENADLIMPRNIGKSRDPLLENEALKTGALLDALPGDDHMQHVQVVGQLVSELQAEPEAYPAALAAAQDHLQKHLAVVQQMGQAMNSEQGGAAGMNPGGNTPGEMGGGATSGGLARNGTPGVAAPGPAAPAGRPL